MRKTFKIDGIYNAMGTIKTQKKLKAINAFDDAKFDLKTCIATVDGEPQDSDIIKVIEEAGFKASVPEAPAVVKTKNTH